MKNDDQFPEDWRSVRWGEPHKVISSFSVIILSIAIGGFFAIAAYIASNLIAKP